MLKQFVNSLFGFFGLKLSRLNRARKYLPKPTIDNVEIVACLLALTDKEITLVQVGACDGVTSDSVYPYLKSGRIRGYLIEPSTVNFEKLEIFYKGIKNVTLIKAAVAESNENRLLYTIKDEGRWQNNGWARQLASFYKDHLLKHGIHENEIQAESTTCLTLKSVIEIYGIDTLDILLIDTEGYDGEIVKMALESGLNPPFIAFENAQLVQNYSQEQLDSLYNILASCKYVWTHDRINTLAIRKDFLKG
ncbi:MAG: FkbM family methyltransferase [Flammeovirgaceae bacterium]|nr:MAG: FkbM family methyltransferase [Flammeovirgaceae bacterium]